MWWMGLVKDLLEGVRLETLRTVGGTGASALQRMSWHYNACTGQRVDNHSHPESPSIPQRMHQCTKSCCPFTIIFPKHLMVIIICGLEVIRHNLQSHCKDINMPAGLIVTMLVLWGFSLIVFIKMENVYFNSLDYINSLLLSPPPWWLCV